MTDIGIGIFSPEYRNIGHRSFYPNRPNSTTNLCHLQWSQTLLVGYDSRISTSQEHSLQGAWDPIDLGALVLSPSQGTNVSTTSSHSTRTHNAEGKDSCLTKQITV